MKNSTVTVVDLSCSLQEGHRTLQEDVISLKERVLILNASSHQNNVKFCGVIEGREGRRDMIVFMGGGTAQSLQLEEAIYPVINKAYRIGRPNNPKRQFARDILVVFADARVLQRILEVGWANGCFEFEGMNISVYPDLPREALPARKQLKETTSSLGEANIKYRCPPPRPRQDRSSKSLGSPVCCRCRNRWHTSPCQVLPSNSKSSVHNR